MHFIDNIIVDSVQVLNIGLPESLPEKSRKGERKNRKANANVVELKKLVPLKYHS